MTKGDRGVGEGGEKKEGYVKEEPGLILGRKPPKASRN